MGEFIDFQHVKQNGNFLAVLAHYDISVTDKGENRRGLCPFHDDTEPSLSVNVETNLFRCFGCTAKGSIIDFVMEIEQGEQGAWQAAKNIATWSDIPTSTRERKQKKPKAGKAKKAKKPETPSPAKTSSPVDDTAAKREQLLAELAALDAPPANDEPSDKAESADDNPPLTFELNLEAEHPYLAERDIDPAIAQVFGLGYANRGMMKGRIAIPVHNEDGELVAYVGRYANAEIPGGEDKYKLPVNFKKSKVLFNWHRLIEREHIVIVEGFFDAIRLHAMSVPVVAVMGNTISDEQIELLKEGGVKRVTMMFDGNEVGREQASSEASFLARSFFVRLAELPEGLEPDTAPAEVVLDFVEPVRP